MAERRLSLCPTKIIGRWLATPASCHPLSSRWLSSAYSDPRMTSYESQFGWAMTPSPNIASYSHVRIGSYEVTVWLWQSEGEANVRWRVWIQDALSRSHTPINNRLIMLFGSYDSVSLPFLARLQIMLSVSLRWQVSSSPVDLVHVVHFESNLTSILQTNISKASYCRGSSVHINF